MPPAAPGSADPFGERRAAAPAGAAGRSVPVRTVAAVVVVAALLAGLVGGALGHQLASDGSGSATVSAPISTRPITTAVPPLSGQADEPAAAVAAALGPAVVQLRTSEGLGSGFVYDRSGLIMTAAHVTDGASSVQVRLADGTRLTGKVLGSDDETDVSVVKIDPPDGLAVATLGTGVQLQVGQVAIAIGSPFGLDQTVTAGIVSALGRSVETPGGVIPAIQTDAPINSGNSGGALADRRGRVIGINDSIVTGDTGTSGNVGVGFAVPIDLAKSVADKIVAGDDTPAGFLGVEGVDATGERAGAQIASVSAGSPADAAGLAEGDVVVALDGDAVASMIDLAAKVRTHQPGDAVDLTVVRDGRERSVSVTLGTAPPG
jgi:putative serine protease PepD